MIKALIRSLELIGVYYNIREIPEAVIMKLDITKENKGIVICCENNLTLKKYLLLSQHVSSRGFIIKDYIIKFGNSDDNVPTEG